MKKSLYKITEEAINIASLLEEGELTEEINNALILNQNELQEKAIDYGYAIKSVYDDITAIDEEIKRLNALKSGKQKAVNRMKEAISNAMLINGIQKIDSSTLKLYFRRSESVEVDSIEQLPEYYQKSKTTVTADKTRIKSDIKDGKNIEGARIIENFNLQIK